MGRQKIPEMPHVSSHLATFGCLCSVGGVKRRAGDFRKVVLHPAAGLLLSNSFYFSFVSLYFLFFPPRVLYSFSFAEKQELSER